MISFSLNSASTVDTFFAFSHEFLALCQRRLHIKIPQIIYSSFSNVSSRIRIQTKFIMFNEIVLLIRENYRSGSAFPLNLCNAKNCKEIAKNNTFTVLALYKD